MDWYILAKFLHVAFAVVWIGGGLIMVLFGVKAERAKNDQELVSVVLQVAWAADRIYTPASILTLIFGLLTAWLGNLWAELWIILGLVGVATTIGLGIGVLSPRAKKVEAGRAAGASPDNVRISREILTIAKFDMVLLFTVVADMVLKPHPGDWVTLTVMAVVLVAAAILFLGKVFRPASA